MHLRQRAADSGQQAQQVVASCMLSAAACRLLTARCLLPAASYPSFLITVIPVTCLLAPIRPNGRMPTLPHVA